MREWASEKEEGVGEKSRSLSLYKGGGGDESPHLPGKTVYSPGAVIDGTVGLPTSILMRIHDKGNAISALTRRVKKTASRYVRSWLRNAVRIITGPWCDVMQSKRVNKLDLWKYSL